MHEVLPALVCGWLRDRNVINMQTLTQHCHFISLSTNSSLCLSIVSLACSQDTQHFTQSCVLILHQRRRKAHSLLQNNIYSSITFISGQKNTCCDENGERMVWDEKGMYQKAEQKRETWKEEERERKRLAMYGLDLVVLGRSRFCLQTQMGFESLSFHL